MRLLFAMLLSPAAIMAQSLLLGPPMPPVPPVPQPIDPSKQSPQPPKAKAPSLPLQGKFREREVLVKFHNPRLSIPVGIRELLNVSTAVGVGGSGWIRLVSTSLSTEGMLVALQSRGDVDYVEPNYIISAGATPNDPSYSSLWGMPKISAPAVWNITTGSQSVVVGVLDSGIYSAHPDLQHNIWSAPAEFTVTLGAFTGVPRMIHCNAGDHGFNAISSDCSPADDWWHGTHVSGTIGAEGDNSIGVTGVNWGVTVLPLKFLGSNGSGDLANAMDALEFAIQVKLRFGTNIRVLNNSWWDSPESEGFKNAIRRAGSYDMLFVAIAGNRGTNNDVTANFPGNYSQPQYLAPHVVTIANTEQNDTLHSGTFEPSNYGQTSVQLAAPGTDIYSTCWHTFTECNSSDYQYATGTSMAAPHVSGAAALALSNANCTASTLGLKAAIVTNVDVPTPSLSVASGGRLNAYRALRGCALQNMAISPAAGSSASQAFTYTFTDLLGYSDLNVVNVLIRDGLDAVSACYVAYVAPSSPLSPNNVLYLVADNGTTLTGGYTPGTAHTLSNSQCSINVASSSVSVGGNVLTLALATTFASGFAGNKIIYAAGRDVDLNNSGWQALGTWGVPTLSTASPSVTSWSPTASSNLSQTFTAVLTDSAGYSNINVVDVLINNGLTAVNACYIAYARGANVLYLVDDAGTALSSPLTPGGSGTVENTQCKISAAGSGVWPSGNSPNSLSVSIAVTFFPGFQNNNVAYVAVLNNSSGNSGWQSMGTWR